MAVELRVLSYNVRGLKDDRAALVDVVRSCDPDVVCVQEAPKYLRWRAKCAALARDCGLLYVTGGGTTGGSALLAHLRVDVSLPTEACLSRNLGRPTRGVAAAVVSKAGARLLVASVHLPLDADRRLVHAGLALRLREAYATPYAVVAGDLNDRPGGPAWEALHAGGLRDLGPSSGPTFPAAAPSKRIDAILGTDGIEVVEHRVLDGPAVVRASDHRPVLATLRVLTT